MPEAAPVVNGNTKLVFEADDPATPSDPSGPVTVINVDPGTGAILKMTVERPLFRKWYCDTLAKLTIKGVELDLSADVGVKMGLGKNKFPLEPKVGINFADVTGNAVFVEHPDAPASVEMYYKMYLEPTVYNGAKIGGIDFALSPGNLDMFVNELESYGVELPEGTISRSDALRALLLIAYKNLPDREMVENIVFPSTVLADELSDVSMLVKGLVQIRYLSFREEVDGYKYYKIEDPLRTAKITMSVRGKPLGYNQAYYDLYMEGDGIDMLRPHDAYGEPIDNPLDPGNPLYLFLDGTFQGEEIAFFHVDELVGMRASGLDFIMPLAFIKDHAPLESSIKFNFVGYTNEVSSFEWKPLTKTVTHRPPPSSGGGPVEVDLGYNNWAKSSGPAFGSPNFGPEGPRSLISDISGKVEFKCDFGYESGKEVLTKVRKYWKTYLIVDGGPSAQQLFSQLHADDLERLRLRDSYITTISDRLELTYRGNVVARIAPELAVEVAAIPDQVIINSGDLKVGTVELLRDYVDPDKFEIRGKIAGNMKESLMVDLKARPNAGQVMELELWPKQGSFLIHEEWITEYHSSLVSDKHQTWSKLVKKVWGEKRFVSYTTQYHVTPYGEIEVTAWRNGQYVELKGLKKPLAMFGKFMMHPAGPAIFTGSIHSAFIAWNMYNDNYKSNYEIYGDVVAMAVDAGIWTAAFRVIAAAGAVTFTQGFMLLMPAMLIAPPAMEYSVLAYREYSANQILGFDGLYLDSNAGLSMFRALYMFFDEEASVGGLPALYPYGISYVWESWIMDYAAEQYVDDILLNEEPLPTQGECDDFDYALGIKAGHYGRMFRNGITDPIYVGLARYSIGEVWNANPDIYGEKWSRLLDVHTFCVDNPYPGNSNLEPPVPVTEIYKKLTSGIVEAYNAITKDSMSVEPIYFVLGYTPAFAEFLEWVLGEILVLKNTMKTKLDGYDTYKDVVGPKVATARAAVWPLSLAPGHEPCSWPLSILFPDPGLPGWLTDDDYTFPEYETTTGSWIDIRTAINTLEELLALLKTTDWSTVAPELEYNLIPNADLEMDDIGETGVNPVTVEIINGAQSNYTIPDHVTLGGIRYYWDVKAVVGPDI
ncbi:MAG: hypothetical protein KAI03_00465, partial [Candidatus Aureabacteria bacterium]|nr:hypothetical protein [Candidatus Auribacterota bacterium]